MKTTDVPAGAEKYDGYVKQQTKLSEFDLRDIVLEASALNGRVAYSGGMFRCYEHGIWPEVDELEIERAVAEQMEIAASLGALHPTYSMQRNVTNSIKSRVYEREDVWNRDPSILVFRNTALDTSTMGTVRHDPEHKVTVALPYDYDRNATAPTWERVLTDVLKDDERR